MGVPGIVMVKPTLPRNLWPHDFLALSTAVVAFTGVYNSCISLPLAIISIILGFLVGTGMCSPDSDSIIVLFLCIVSFCISKWKV